MEFVLKSFEELSVYELYKLLQLRIDVFIVEQYCVYPDLDDADQSSYHLMAFSDRELVAYSRLLPPNIKGQCSIGRVVVSRDYRTEGLGRQLMIESIKRSARIFPNKDIMIHAQAYLLDFYISLGFKVSGSPFYEDGILHIKMIRFINEHKIDKVL